MKNGKIGKIKSKKQEVFKNRQTRMEIIKHLSIKVGLNDKDVSLLFSELTSLISGHMNPKGSGEFIIPMIGIKVLRVKKNACKAKRMISPLTSQEILIPAKPKRLGIKLSARKTLKEMIQN